MSLVPDLRRLFIAAVAAAVMAFVGAEAKADFETGNSLYAKCASSNQFDQAFCYGYIEAIADAARTGPVVSGRVLGWTHCPRDQVSAIQMAAIAVQFLTVHPEKRDLGADGLVAEALEEAFPCR